MDKRDKKYRNKLLRVSSRDRDTSNSSETNSFFSVEIPDYATNRVVAYEVVYASCPNVFYNINESNNVINFRRRFAGDIFSQETATITPGQYTIDQLLTALGTALTSGSGGTLLTITATLNDITQKIELGAAGSATDYIQLSTNSGGNYVESPIDPIIGNDTNDIILEGAAAVSLNLLPNLAGTQEVYIHSQDLSISNLAEAQGTFSTLDVISLAETPFGALGSVYYPDHKLHRGDYLPFESSRNLTGIRIALRDSEGRLLELDSNQYFTVILRLHYK